MAGPRHDLVARGIAQQLRDQPLVQGVTSTLGLHVPLNRHSKQRKIPEEIQDLVTHELIGHAKAFGIEHAPLIQNDGVVERPAARKASTPESLHFMQEAEGASPAELALEHALAKFEVVDGLPTDRRVGE